MMIKKFKVMLAGVICLLGIHSTTNAAVIELSLLLDGSGSVGSANWDTQVDAYASIFGSATFYDDYVTGTDTLWVNANEFSTGAANMVGWTEITDNATANAFGAAIAAAGAGVYDGGWTHTKEAIDLAVSQLGTHSADRMVIDVSTDGEPCQSGSCGNPGTYYTSTLATLAAAAGNGITTNFIGIGSDIDAVSLGELAAAGGGFSVTAPDFAGFEAALSRKLHREISGVPAPATLALFGLGLAGLGLGRRRKVS